MRSRKFTGTLDTNMFYDESVLRGAICLMIWCHNIAGWCKDMSRTSSQTTHWWWHESNFDQIQQDHCVYLVSFLIVYVQENSWYVYIHLNLLKFILVRLFLLNAIDFAWFCFRGCDQQIILWYCLFWGLEKGSTSMIRRPERSRYIPRVMLSDHWG